jgi:hypothetical protein
MSVDKKISQLASGAPAQAGDEYVVARSGANYKLTLTNIAASMPPIGATTPNTGSFTSLTNSGNLTFSSTAQRITGDTVNATASNRLAFQNSTPNSTTSLNVIPNGTTTNTLLSLEGDSAYANGPFVQVANNPSSSNEARITSGIRGTASYMPLTIYTGGSERMRLDTSGNLGIGTASPVGRLRLAGSSANVFPNKGANLWLTDTNAATSVKNWALASDAGVYKLITGSDDVTAGELAYQVTRVATSTQIAEHIFYTGASAERMRIDSSGNVGIGTSNPGDRLDVVGGNIRIASGNTVRWVDAGNIRASIQGDSSSNAIFSTAGSERMRISSSGNVGIGTTSTNPIGDNTVGTVIFGSGAIAITRDSNPPLLVNRKTNDGNLVEFYQDGVLEGSISVAGNTVSYNPFMGSHYTEIVGAMPTLKGTVLESLDELVDGKYSNQDRLPKAKVSDTVGSSAVYGVYFAPDSDPDTNDGILAAALGASWVRIAAGVTVQRGDLLESNGDGCAKVQSDDIIRSKTIGKVTSTTVADTYPDGSYIVPCVLYCG